LQAFATLKTLQSLKPDFADYLTMLVKLFNCVISQPLHYKCILHIEKDNTANLFYHQILDYKTLSLFTHSFDVEEEERVKLHIKYRHRLARAEYQEMEYRL
jgi:hypothetical protein